MSRKYEDPMSEAMYYILLALTEPLHGYAIIEKVNEISRGRIETGPGTLYGILKRLEKDKWIELDNENGRGRRRVYKMTSRGRGALQNEYNRLMCLVEDGENRLKGERTNE